jgi:hypothetical protein
MCHIVDSRNLGQTTATVRNCEAVVIVELTEKEPDLMRPAGDYNYLLFE